MRFDFQSTARLPEHLAEPKHVERTQVVTCTTKFDAMYCLHTGCYFASSFLARRIYLTEPSPWHGPMRMPEPLSALLTSVDHVRLLSVPFPAKHHTGQHTPSVGTQRGAAPASSCCVERTNICHATTAPVSDFNLQQSWAREGQSIWLKLRRYDDVCSLVQPETLSVVSCTVALHSGR